MKNKEKIKAVLNHINQQGYNRFVMRNNINDDKILAFGINFTNEPNINILKNNSTGKYALPNLVLNLDPSQDLVLTEYVDDLLDEANRIRWVLHQDLIKRETSETNKIFEWFNPNDISFTEQTLNLEYGDILLKIECECDKQVGIVNIQNYIGEVNPKTIFQLLTLDESRSCITDDNIYMIFNPYYLGKLDKNQALDLKLVYLELLDAFEEPEKFNSPKYFRSCFPYCKKDLHNNKFTVGLWDNYKNKPINETECSNALYSTMEKLSGVISKKNPVNLKELFGENFCKNDYEFNLEVGNEPINNCVIYQ